MLSLSVLMLAVVGLGQCAQVHGLGGPFILRAAAGAGSENDIPQRCVDLSVTPVSCPAAAGADDDALLPHPDDCQLFYYCVGPAAAPLCRTCPAGLHFSPTEHVCDDPARAGCLLAETPAATH